MNLDDVRSRAVLTAAETARLLGCSTRTVHRRMDAGELPELWLGSHRRLVPVPKLLAMLGADPPEQRSAPVGGGAGDLSTATTRQARNGG